MNNEQIVEFISDVVKIYNKDRSTINGKRIVDVFKQILEFINQQQSEIERLEGILGKRCEICKELNKGGAE